MLRLDRIAIFIVDIRRRRGLVADLFIAVDALDLDFDWSRRVAIDRREVRVRGNDVVFRDRVRRDFRLAVHNRHVVVVQALEGSFCCIREGQLVAIAYGCRPLTIRAVQRSFIVIADRAKILEQRFFRIAVDQALTRLGAVRIVVLRRIERRTIDRLCIADIDCQISLINGQIPLCLDDFVVDACTILETDIFHIDGICIRIFIEMSRRVAILTHSIAATRFDGKVIGALVKFIIVDNRFARCAFLITGERCGEGPVVDGRVAVGLAAAAVDVDLASEDFDGAAILCSGIFIAACFTFVRQVVAFRSSFDVVNRLVIGFTGRCFIAALTRCSLCPAFARERAAAVVVVGYVAFVEGIRIFVDVMLFIILSGKGCLSGGRDIVIRQFLTVDFRHIVSGDINGRLYLEDVLVAVVLTCRIRSARRTPLCVRAAVEVRAKLIGIWRVEIDLPVAAFAGRDSRNICRGQVPERTACTLHVNDNSIIVLRSGVQRTVIMLFVQYDRAICRGQVDVFMRRDAIDMDVARSLDVDAFSIRCNAVANCDVLARDTDTFVRVNNARVVAAAADCNIASVDLDILQSNRVAEVTGNIDFRIASMDDESRMRQILFLNKTTDCSSSLRNIIPIRGRTETDRDDWAGVVRLFLRIASILRITVIPFDIEIVGSRAIVVGKFRALAIIGHAFRTGNPVIAIRMFRIGRIWIFRRRLATTSSADNQLILLCLAGQRILKSRRDCSEIRIARIVRAFRRTLSHRLGTGPSFRLYGKIRRKIALPQRAQLIIRRDSSIPSISISATLILADNIIIIRFDEVLPAFQTGRYPLIGVAGVDCAGDGNCTACAIALPHIKRQRAAVQADGHVAVKADCAAIRLDIAIARLALVAEVRANRTGLNRRAAARRERTAIRRDIGVDEDGTEAIAICIRMEVDIQRSRRRRDSRVDRDVALCLKCQGRIFDLRLIDGRIHRDGRDFIGIRCLYRNSRALIQQVVDGSAVDPRDLIAAGRAGCSIAAGIAAIRIAIRDSFTARRFRSRDDDLKRIEQPFAGLAGLACCVDVDRIADLEVVVGGLDEAAVYCAGCVERRSVFDMGLCADCLD